VFHVIFAFDELIDVARTSDIAGAVAVAGGWFIVLDEEDAVMLDDVDEDVLCAVVKDELADIPVSSAWFMETACA